MENISISRETKLINKTAEELAMLLLSLNGSQNVISYMSEQNGIYEPETKGIYLQLDVIPILAYNKDYGMMKLKAMIKPWLCNLFALNSKIDAVCFIRDTYGRATLVKAVKIDETEIKPQKLIFRKLNTEDVPLITSKLLT